MKTKAISTESIEDFLKYKVKWLPPALQKDIGQFNVFRIEDCVGTDKAPKYSRRDFYKISIATGESLYHYGDKTLEISGPTLMFFNPSVPYVFAPISDNLTGFFCIFKESFFTEHLRTRIKDLPMFMPGNRPSYSLNQQQSTEISNVFRKMLEEIGSDYQFKYDLIRNYIMEIVHAALKIQPVEHLYPNGDANARITTVFSELLERQFPIESPSQRFSLRSPKDFAEQLSIHVNHLNRALRSTTGKTTSEHIFERLIAEAVALLKYTDWNISEISYSLGFEEPSHFNNFFKKHTSFTPSALRT
jgi:AraC family transcriptional regulator, transcriptional activator of pobA